MGSADTRPPLTGSEGVASQETPGPCTLRLAGPRPARRHTLWLRLASCKRGDGRDGRGARRDRRDPTPRCAVHPLSSACIEPRHCGEHDALVRARAPHPAQPLPLPCLSSQLDPSARGPSHHTLAVPFAMLLAHVLPAPTTFAPPPFHSPSCAPSTLPHSPPRRSRPPTARTALAASCDSTTSLSICSRPWARDGLRPESRARISSSTSCRPLSE